MNRISFQWRITLMTAVLIAGACICLNLLLYRSGATGMDNLNGYVLQYQQSDEENLTIEIPDDQMSDFLVQFSQEVYDAKAVFGRKLVHHGSGNAAERSDCLFRQRQGAGALEKSLRSRPNVLIRTALWRFA